MFHSPSILSWPSVGKNKWILSSNLSWSKVQNTDKTCLTCLNCSFLSMPDIQLKSYETFFFLLLSPGTSNSSAASC